MQAFEMYTSDVRAKYRKLSTEDVKKKKKTPVSQSYMFVLSYLYHSLVEQYCYNLSSFDMRIHQG